MIENRKKLLKGKNTTYDQEWIELIKEAKKSGLTRNEIRNFLQKRDAYTSLKMSQKKTDLQHINSI